MHEPGLQVGRPTRGILLLFAVLLAFGLVAPGVQAAPGGNPGGRQEFDPGSDSEDNHCYAATGADWNQLLNVSEQILTRGCTSLNSGEFFVPTSAGWIVNTSFESFPEWFTPPPGKTPVEDFLDKVGSVEYVIDTGTRQEHAYLYSDPLERVIAFGDCCTEPAEWADFDFAILVAKLRPESVGEHTIQTFLTMSADHCDGIGDVTDENCLLAGVRYAFSPVRPFTVEKGAAQGEKP